MRKGQTLNVEQIESVIPRLKTLQHSKYIGPFDPNSVHMKFMTTLGREGNECRLLHQGSCWKYKKSRISKSLITALKIQFVALVIPALIS